MTSAELSFAPNGLTIREMAEPPHEDIICPVCGGKSALVYDRYHQKVYVCVDCKSGLTIPSSAAEVQRLKRERKWTPKPEE